MTSEPSSTGKAVHRDRSPLSDARLIQQCLQGDEDAWDRLLRRYGGLVYSTALRCGLSHDDAADVLQLVSMAMLEHLADLRDTTRLVPWLATTTRRFALQILERTRRQKGALDTVAQEAEASLPAEADMAQAMLDMRDQQLVREAMELLPERCRRLLTMLFSNDPLPYAEIAKSLGVAIGSLGPTRRRCLDKLRAILEELDF